MALFKLEKAYKCEWCGEIFEYENAAGFHTEDCPKDPKKRTCISCIHYGRHTKTLDVRDERVVYCSTAKTLFILSPNHNCHAYERHLHAKVINQKRQMKVKKDKGIITTIMIDWMG